MLFVAGFLSGVINAVAGGGTFITFGALTLIGVPPISANATSSIAQLAVGQSDVGLYINEFMKRVTSAPLKTQQQQAPASGFQTVVPQP